MFIIIGIGLICMRKFVLFALLAIFILPMAFCVDSLSLIEPGANIVRGQTVDYGTVGPGQTFTVQMEPNVRNATDNSYLGRWDTAYATSLPDGWTSKPSKIYDTPLVIEVTVAKDAPEGDYTVPFLVGDEGGLEHLGDNISFSAIVHVKHDVMTMSVDPLSMETGAGQPARFSITLSNTGSAKDVYTVNASGVKGWEFEKKVYLLPGTSKTITFEVVGNEETYYNLIFMAQSDSSPLIHKEKPVQLNVHTNLISDYKATSNGVLLFPIMQIPVYSIAGMLGLLFP